MRSDRPAVQTDYVVEIITEIDVQEEKSIALNDAFTLIDLDAFKEIYLKKFPLQRAQDAEAFWYNLFGFADAEDPVVGHPPCYLTGESCSQLLEAYPLFLSGVDYKHLPRGFFIAKNPQEVGVRNILHYSSYLAEHSIQANDPLAVVLSDKRNMDDTEEEKDELSTEPLSSWYDFLSQRCISKGEIICTQSELRAAFKRFVTGIQDKGLTFYPPDFSHIADKDFNPIVLLGRWETIMSNPALRPEDLEVQWSALTKLDCTKGYSVLRAVTDYQYSARPCTIVLPEMLEPQTTSRYRRAPEYPYSRLNNVENSEDAAQCDGPDHFWRYLSFQQDRNSIRFYRQCLEIIRGMSDLDERARENIHRILLDCTTGFSRDPSLSEDDQLDIWRNFCHIINTIHTSSAIIRLQYRDEWGIQYVKGESLRRIGQFKGLNILFVKDCADTIVRHLGASQVARNAMMSGDPLSSLDDLSQKICTLTASGPDFYKGAKFYFQNGAWIDGFTLESYTEIQHQLSELEDRCPLGRYVEWRELLAALKPLVSTFSLDTRDLRTVHGGLADFLWHIPAHKLQKEVDKLTLILRHFRITSRPLQPDALIDLFNACPQIADDEHGNHEIPVIDFLERQYSSYIPVVYLEKKRNEILLARAGGLNEQQMQNISRMCFLPEIRDRIIQTEGSLVRNFSATNTENLEIINDKFVNCSILLSETDFDFLTDKIAETSAQISTADEKREVPASSLDLLLQSILDNGSTEAFSRIYYANKIVGCTSPDIFQRFHLYVSDIRAISREVRLSRIVSEDLLAKFVLNATPDELADEEFKYRLAYILAQFAEITTAHPHVTTDILKAFDHFNGQENANQKIIRLTNSLTEIHALLQSDDHAEGRQNMVIFHRLTARFYTHPASLSELVEQIMAAAKGNPDRQRCLLKAASARIQDDESLRSFCEILTYIANGRENSEELYQFMLTHFSRPPCISANTIATHISETGSFNSNTLTEHFDPQMKSPFGSRKLEYAFNLEKFNMQKILFEGVAEDVFTAEVGNKMAEMTDAFRNESVQDLYGRFARIRGTAQEAKGELNNDDRLELLCVCTEMLARTTPQKDPVTGEIISQEINTTQMMALHALLTAHDTSKIMSQVDTGEGKSRITIILAACMVALGRTVDMLTSDLMLSERDYLVYNDFFQSLSISTGFVSSTTPSQLYQLNGVNFSDNSQLILMRNKSDIDRNAAAWLDPSTMNRCLIIDEADKFVHDKSRDAYNYADRSAALSSFTWIYPFLVRYVRANPPQDALDATEVDQFMTWLRGNSPDNMQIAAAAALLAKNPVQIKTWIKSAQTANGMTRGVDYETTDPETLFPVIDTENNTRFSRKVLVLDNGRTVDNSTFSGGVHQCLCAIENINSGTDDFVILPENKTLRRSFPVSFLQQYKDGCVLGFSGTTRGELRSQHDSINYEGYTYITVPRHNKLIREDKPVWGAAGKSQQFEFIKRDILKALKENRPVLLICRDDLQSSELFQQLSDDVDIQNALLQGVPPTRVHSLTTKQNEMDAVRLAGRPGQITVSTAGMFSRGVDIHSENLHVIAAYIPTEEDEIQIKGRTGRIGKPGTYRMIPDVKDPDSHVNGTTYNLEKEVRKAQRQMSAENITEEEISKLYANFLEEVHRRFLNSYSKVSYIDQKIYLEQWADYLDDLNKDWNNDKQPLLACLNARDLDAFKHHFAAFVQRWSGKIPLVDNLDEDSLSRTSDNWTDHTFTALISYRDLPAPTFAGKVQAGYDVSDDGQTRIYSSLFAQELAFLRGERPLFANTRAWWQGRGALFPDLKALLAGDRPLFANLRATIARLIESINHHQEQNPLVQPR